MECRLLTGRTHQIRVSMAEIGCPPAGDGKYGKGDVNRRYHETRLYSYKLRFDFPTDAGLLNYLRGRNLLWKTCPSGKNISPRGTFFNILINARQNLRFDFFQGFPYMILNC